MAGGLGGLGGGVADYLNSPTGGNMLQALGFSLMSSPRSAPLQNFGEYYTGLKGQRMKQDAIDLERSDVMASRQALEAVLVARGVPQDQARIASVNPAAAKALLDQADRDQQKAERREFLSGITGLGGLGGAPVATGETTGGIPALPGVSDASSPAVAPSADSGGAITGLPSTAARGTIMRGEDGKSYQYAQTSGDIGGNGGWGWIEVNPEALAASSERPQLEQTYGGASVFSEPGAAQTDYKRLTPGGAIADRYLEATPAPGPGAEIPLAPQQVAQSPAAEPVQSGGTPLENLYAQRDQLATMLASAPDERSFNQGKIYLDALDTKIEREQEKFGKNKTYQYLSTNDPEVAELVRSGAISPKDGLSIAAERKKAMAGGGDSTHGTPLYTEDEEGNLHVNFAAKTGDGLVRAETRPGEKILGPYDTALQRASGGALGKIQGESLGSLPTELETADQAVTDLDALIEHPGLSAIAGPIDQFRPSFTMGAQGRDALARFNQAKGRAFLQAFGMLKGGGQITEVEGLKAEQAMARMDRAQGETEFKQALEDFRDAVKTGAKKLRERAGLTAAPAPSPEAGTSGGGNEYKSKYGLE